MGFTSDACWFLLIKTLLIKKIIKKRGGAKIRSERDFFAWPYTVYFRSRVLSVFPSSSDASTHFHIESPSIINLMVTKSFIK